MLKESAGGRAEFEMVKSATLLAFCIILSTAAWADRCQDLADSFWSNDYSTTRRLAQIKDSSVNEIDRLAYLAWGDLNTDYPEEALDILKSLQTRWSGASHQGRMVYLILCAFADETSAPNSVHFKAALQECKAPEEACRVRTWQASASLDYSDLESARGALEQNWRQVISTPISPQNHFELLLVQSDYYRQTGQFSEALLALASARPFAKTKLQQQRWWGDLFSVQVRMGQAKAETMWNAYRLASSNREKLLILCRLTQAKALGDQAPRVRSELSRLRPSYRDWPEKTWHIRILSIQNSLGLLSDQDFQEHCQGLVDNSWQVQYAINGHLASRLLRRKPELFKSHIRTSLELASHHQVSRLNDTLREGRPAALYLNLITDLAEHGALAQALETAQKGLMECESREFDKLGVYLGALIQWELVLCRLPAAKLHAQKLMDLAEVSNQPIRKAELYTKIITSLLNASIDSNRFLAKPNPPRLTEGTPAEWLWNRLCLENSADRRILRTLSDTAKLYHQRRNSELESICILMQGIVYSFLGKGPEAIDFYRQSDACNPAMSHVTNELLARELFAQGDVNQAVERARKAVGPISRRIDGRFLASSTLATLLCETGKPQEAVSVLEADIKGGTSHSPIHAIEITLGRAHRLAGHPKEARAVFEKLLNEIQSYPAHPALPMVYRELAELSPEKEALTYRDKAYESLVHFGRIDSIPRVALAASNRLPAEEALQYCQKAWDQCLERRAQLPAELQREALKPKFLQPLFERQLQLLSALSDNPKRQELMAKLVAQWQNFENSQNELFTPQNLAPGPGRELLTQLEQQRARLSELGEFQPQLTSNSDFLTLQAEAKGQFLSTLNRIRQTNPDFEARVSAQGSDLAGLQSRLAPGRLLVQYYQGSSILYIQTISREKMESHEVALERSRFESLVADYQKALTDPFKEAERQKIGQSLSSLMLSPIKTELNTCQELIVLPSGSLWYLPLETLTDEQGKFLIERFPISYAGAPDLHRLAQRNQTRTRVQEPINILALAPVSEQELPSARHEVEAVGRLSAQSTLLLEKQATHQELIGRSPQFSVLHIATHSYIKADVNQSYLQLSDGPLKLSEIYGLPLQNNSLVVLSSCQSGIGEKDPQREVAALSTAFRAAGASSVMASLWPVDDEATAKLFPLVYQTLVGGGITRSQALRAAKLKMLSDPNPKFHLPSFWGAFTLLGQPD